MKHAILGAVSMLIPDATDMDLLCGRAEMEPSDSCTGGLLEFWIQPYAERYEFLTCPDCQAIVTRLRERAHIATSYLAGREP